MSGPSRPFPTRCGTSCPTGGSTHSGSSEPPARGTSTGRGHAAGSRLHHSAGVWPVVVSDSTEVLDSRVGRSLRLRARGWPLGEAEVGITLTAQAPAPWSIDEVVASGPGRLVPAPVRTVVTKIRNVETLRRLAFIAERRRRGLACPPPVPRGRGRCRRRSGPPARRPAVSP